MCINKLSTVVDKVVSKYKILGISIKLEILRNIIKMSVDN
ncbi:hypothetical protein SpAn4DRAFT_4910 [Sporomusa ovata]|uniref:Uncharacterized protein n=1 Tax=Sporomusa ovata TaxID=2378 RepID=A0A0U1KS10_9FIRM|nr:hypothetical protein SpAn4DRAFT_4910 [Sporomusa ovata]